MEKLSVEYWNNAYLTNQIGWDIGSASTPLREYFDQLSDKSIRILIPGAGNAYEAEYLWKKGFRNVFVLDFSQAAIQRFCSRFPDFPSENILQQDFFIHQLRYDLIVEQTFFTSIFPSQRQAYVEKTAQLLHTNGKLVGLFFNHHFSFDGPPFGGSQEEYRLYFSPYFYFKIFETAYNSIKPRKDRELFMLLEKKIF
ncbi:MAG TPA: SAM-dependent methyltransferase [Bacteroidales bacterium]|nr:SAM-dependent methyltransferase [Bacteroidales bacterium]